MAPKPELLKIGEVARRAGVSRGTIQHYLREGLLPPPVKTHRNMAWYEPACVDRIRAIKTLQSQSHLPLSEIRTVLEQSRGKGSVLASAFVEAQKASLMSGGPPLPGGRVPRDQAASVFGLPPGVVDALVELGLVNVGSDGFAGADLEVLAAVSNLARLGFTEDAGFSPEDLVIYRDALEALLHKELRTFLGRVVALDGDRAPELARAAVDGATVLMLALRKKLILDLVQDTGPEIVGALGV